MKGQVRTSEIAQVRFTDRALTVRDVAAKLRASLTTTKAMIAREEIPSFRVGRLRRVMESAVDAYIARRSAEERASA